MTNRVNALMAKGGLDGVYVLHKPENIRHFSGFTGEGMLVFGRGVRVLVTDFRYEEQAQRQSPGWEVSLIENGVPHASRIAQAAARLGGAVRLEFDHITVNEGEALAKALGGQATRPMDGLPEKLRVVKEDVEAEAIGKAAAITDATFAWVLNHVKVGMTELELALDMFVYMRRLGADETAFSSIVASGPNSSLPHAEPSGRKIQPGDLLTLDFGAKWGGYCSDFTRTIAFGKVDAELRKVYDIVLEAQLRALDALACGKTGVQIDAVARGVIEAAGYGPRFGHGLGHGVGRMIHEEPRLSKAGNTPLEPGMVVTVEPGIYLPGKGGVRIEDLCLMTRGGYRNYCVSTKEYIEL
jgi:Xaa-Pro aminopeptidase